MQVLLITGYIWSYNCRILGQPWGHNRSLGCLILNQAWGVNGFSFSFRFQSFSDGTPCHFAITPIHEQTSILVFSFSFSCSPLCDCDCECDDSTKGCMRCKFMGKITYYEKKQKHTPTFYPCHSF